MSSKDDKQVIEAAGGLVERQDPSGTQIALVYRERYGSEWTLPKGKRKRGETWQETALREVQEETGCDSVIIRFAGTTGYLADGSPKVVLFWRMQAEEVKNVVSTDEVEKVTWLTPNKAINILKHDQEKELLKRVYHLDFLDFTSNAFSKKFRKAVANLVQSRRKRRLYAALRAYSVELNHGAHVNEPSPREWFSAARELLACAEAAVHEGDIDTGWKCFMAAQRMELLGLTDDKEKEAAAQVIHAEAEKLTSWRKQAVQKLVKPTKRPIIENLYQAALIRDEHYSNQAYKDGLRRSYAFILACILSVVILAVIWMAYQDRLPGTTDADTLTVVAIFGLFGAATSAVLRAPGAADPSRIPELTSTIRVTLLRLLVGAASAILIYFVVKSNMYSAIITTRPDVLAILVLAFVSGFTERLVMRVVEHVAGKE